MENKQCPECGADCWRDEVDIGVGVLGGPWRCSACAWSESLPYDAPTEWLTGE